MMKRKIRRKARRFLKDFAKYLRKNKHIRYDINSDPFFSYSKYLYEFTVSEYSVLNCIYDKNNTLYINLFNIGCGLLKLHNDNNCVFTLMDNNDYANRFADEVLMPKNLLINNIWASIVTEEEELCERYGVTMQMLSNRRFDIIMDMV